MLNISSPSLHANPIIPFLVAALGIASFSAMDAVMKALVLTIGAFSAVLWRNVIGAGLAGILFLARGGRIPARSVLKIHAKRSALVACMSILFFWSLKHLPLAEAIGLSFIAPVIALYLAAILLGETVGKAAILSSLIGLLGVVIMVTGRISGTYSADVVWGIVAVLASAILYAWNLIIARQQAQVAEPEEITFFQSAFTSLFLIPAAPWFLIPAHGIEWLTLLYASLLALFALLLLSWAYARAEAHVLIPVEYTAFIWAAILGWWWFEEVILWPTIAGTLLIVIGSFIAAQAKPEETKL